MKSKINIFLFISILLLPHAVFADGFTMAPDGTYVGGDSFTIAPDGTYESYGFLCN